MSLMCYLFDFSYGSWSIHVMHGIGYDLVSILKGGVKL